MSFHAVDWFTVSGSLASASAVAVAVGIFLYERGQEKRKNIADNLLKVEAMNRLLAHKSVPLCQMADTLCLIFLHILTTEPIGVGLYLKEKTKSIRLIYPGDEPDTFRFLPFKIHENGRYLSDDIMLNCSILADKNNELLATAIKINNGIDAFADLFDVACIYAKQGKIADFKKMFDRNKKGEFHLFGLVTDVISAIGILEPEIQYYPIYNNVIAKFEIIKKEIAKLS